MTYLFIFLTPIINLALCELFFFRPSLFFFSIATINLFLLVAIWRITGFSILKKEFWNFTILPVLFTSSLACYSLLIVHPIIIHCLFVLNFLFTLYFLKNIYRGEQKEFLENVSSYINLLNVFFAFSTIYGLEAFLGTPVWMLIITSGIIIFLIIYQIFWANKLHAENIVAYIFLTGLLLLQLVWSIYFLPYNFNALGMLITICYYVLIGTIKLSLSNKLTSRSLKLYLASGAGFLILILLTIKWI